jgi:hypothetical protein
VREEYPTDNFGSSPFLWAGDSFSRNNVSLLKFDVPPAAAARATLSVCIELGFAHAGNGVTVHTVADNSWSESSVTLEQ